MRAKKVDTTHAQIRDALRKAGVSVYSLATVGNGVPDLLCGYRSWWCLVEAKTGKRDTNELQRKFINECQGPVIVVSSGEEAVAEFFKRWAVSRLEKV